ncbi:PucR family transcriptional regulator [Actinomadura opuntiae]|uniref:PucR family transcriptional regulator n=1 Tax=Actinomadura sp. OS1-43 TaxID=604315 RepID=UPI00255AEA86|nr:PucR family transcriptional regulator [Actinomadura sp. OS1-43]MDL4814187.1 helix-turn-helix domain-containing protein [Actinomadura sp. OS1-43]
MPSTFEERQHTVVQSAVRALHDRLPELTDRLVLRLQEAEGPDGRRAFGSRAFRESARSGLQSALEAIATRGMERPDISFARRIGRRYAEAGLPLETVLRTYRLAGGLLWECMADVVTERYPDDLAVLVSGARRALAMIDQLSDSITESYHQTWRDMRKAEVETALETLDDLLDGHEDDTDRVRSVGALLGLPEHGRYVVVAANARTDPVPPDEVVGTRVIWRSRPGALLGVALLDAAGIDDLAAGLRPLIRRPAGIGLPVDRLADLGRARWLADLARSVAAAEDCGETMGTAPEPGSRPRDANRLVRLDERLPAAFMAAQPELARHLRDTVVGPLLDLDRGERESLMRTVAAWLDCHGSTARAAQRLFCHRNTVLGRLRRIQRLTGRRLDHPREATELVLALEAVRVLQAPGAIPEHGANGH